MMRTLMKLSLGTLVIAGALVSTAGRADAGEGYVCAVDVRPWASEFGSKRFVTFALYTSPGCQGSYVGDFRILGAGQTAVPGALGNDDVPQMAIFQTLYQAMVYGNYILAFEFLPPYQGNVAQIAFRP